MSHITCSWSGGIDSTALIAQALFHGHSAHAVSLGIYGGKFGMREAAAREQLKPILSSLGRVTYDEVNADWIWAFAYGRSLEIPRRNRYIIDHLIAAYPTSDIGLGEYIGADTWVVRDHVGAADADARALTSYVYQEYGLGVRLWTLSDFGEARYKHDRLAMGLDTGVDMVLTTNCLSDEDAMRHCGRCYKCIERSVAFAKLEVDDSTLYLRDPRQHPAWIVYSDQMDGNYVALPPGAFAEDIVLPGPRIKD